MKPSLQFKLTQQLSMTPQLQQAIRLLQLSSLELELEVRTALESNLLLEPIEPEEETAMDSVFPPFEAVTEWGGASRHALSSIGRKITSLKKQEMLLQKPLEMTLHQYLLSQMELAHFSAREQTIAAALIDAISEEGYCLSAFSEIQETLAIQTDVNELESILHRIQAFEPLGIGARTVSECLRIQLDALPAATPWLLEAKLLVQEHLASLGARNFAHLKKCLQLDQPALTAVIKLLTTLNPRPGMLIAPGKCDYLVPDLLAWKKDGRVIIQLNDALIPKFRMYPNYAYMIQSATTETGLETFREHLKEAKWLIKGLQTRNDTLLKVAQSIFEEQRAFFDYGEEAMKPLTLQDIAAKVALHESTVSRITTHKTILTPKGLYELKYFFSPVVPASRGEQSCSVAVRALIKKLITEESTVAPFSDHKIMTLLTQRGINIARRTVTKYREAMHIPASNDRKVKY